MAKKPIKRNTKVNPTTKTIKVEKIIEDKIESKTEEITKLVINNIDKKNNIEETFDISHILNNDTTWQMSIDERIIADYIIQNLKVKDIAIEIGSLKGGFTNILAKNFKKVISCDLDHKQIDKNRFNNVEWVTGNTRKTLAELIEDINDKEDKVSFIFVDGDHTYDGVMSDIEDILLLKPKTTVVVLFHDTWYKSVRLAICESEIKNNKYVYYVNTDLCSVSSVVCKTMWGGLGIMIMKPDERDFELSINQSNDLMYLELFKSNNR